MLTTEQIIAKIYAQADKFNEFYSEGKWAQAKYAYYIASITAGLMNLPEDEMIALFGSSAYTAIQPVVLGLFDERKVKYAFWKVLKGHENERRALRC